MLIFLDSFDDRTSATYLSAKYDTSSGTLASAGGRTGNCMTMGVSAYARKSITAAATVIMGAAIKVGTAVTTPVFQLLDGTSVQCNLVVDSALSISITNSSGTVIAGPSATGIMSTSAFRYVEWKCTINNTTGAITVKVDGTVVLTATGLNNRNTANNYANVVGLGQTSGGTTTTYFDDFYVANTSGSVNNDFLGTLNIECLYPTGAGNSTNWTIGGSSPAATNWQSVNDTDPNDGVTLVTNTTSGIKDTYQTANLVSTTGSIVGVQTQIRALATNPGSGTLKKVIRSGGTDYLGSGKTLTTSYADYQEIDEVDPATSTAWTISGVNSAEIGIQSA